MEGNVKVKVTSRSNFGGVADELQFAGSGAVEKTAYGWHVHYEAKNTEDGSPIVSDVKVDTKMNRVVLVNDGEGGYGLLLDPNRATVTQIPTEQGMLTLNVTTKKVACDLSSKKWGSITVEYILMVGLQPMSALCVTIELTKE